MKKKLLTMVCLLGCAMAFTACNNDSVNSSTSDESTSSCNHVYDDDGDAVCNECGHVRELSKFTVTFDSDGGSAVEAQSFAYGTSASELASVTSTKAGYTFAGWTLSDGTEIAADTTITGNITVKAKWEIVTYSAKIVRADGGDETVTFTVENRTEKLAAIALTANDAQYTYSWTTALPDELALNNEQVFTETRTVNKYTVTFDSDGGSAVEAQSFVYGTSASELASVTSTKAGYTFAGWTLSDGTEIAADTTITENITVKASWTPCTDTAYTVAIYVESLEGYSETATQTLVGTGTTGETITIDEAWLTEKAFSIPTGHSLDSENSELSKTIAADGSLVLKVRLKLNEYTVTINGKTSTEKHGATLSLPANPVQSGYIFKEWQIGGAKVDETYAITSNTVVTAAWYVDLTSISLFEIDLSSSDDYVIDTTSIGKVTNVSLNGVALTVSSSTDTVLTIANAAIKDNALKGGEYGNLILTTSVAEYMVKFTAVTKYLNVENITSFVDLKALLEADMNGYYVLTSNIDLAATGSNSQRVTRAIGYNGSEFNGVLDGRGFAIQNMEFNWRQDGGNHDHSLFQTIGANGAVKNLAVMGVTVKTNSARSAGLAINNNGTIENCFVEYNATNGVSGSNYEYGQAALVLKNNGTMTDCLAKLTISTDLGANYICLVTDNNGAINNVNGIVSVVGENDATTTNSGNGTKTNCINYTNLAAFFAADCAENYTSTYWTMDAETFTVKLGDLLLCLPSVTEMTTVVALDKSASQALNLDISELGSSVREVKINNDVVAYTVTDGVLTVAYSELFAYTGECTLTVDMGAAIYEYSLIMVTKYLNAENVTSFVGLKTLLEADMNGYYVLTSNIDLTAAGNNSQRVTRAIGYNGSEFNGVLDGRGFAIQNMEFNWRQDGGSHDHSLFQTIGANGAVKNLAVTGVTVKTASARAAGLAINNNGTIENCFVEYNATAGVSGSNSQWGQAALVLKNNGTMTDCLAKLTISTDLGTNYICLVTDNNGTINNVNGIVSVVGENDATTTNSGSGTKTHCRNVTDAAAFFTADCDENYTSSYWNFDEENGKISFGENAVVA